VFGVGLNVFLSLFWSLQKPILPLPPSFLRQFKNCVAADLEIGIENCVTADFWQRKTASLPIQEIGSQNCIAADRFRNRQRNRIAADSEIDSDGGVINSTHTHTHTHIYILLGVYIPPLT
jgi:hypothetical protein